MQIEETAITQQQKLLAAGRMTSRELVEAYLSRIETIDRTTPKLNSIIEINPDALSIADKLDRDREARAIDSPLYGIPVLLKDNIATIDKMQTTAGSLALLGSRPLREAFVVTKLRQAGAIILGKANLSEWANFRSSNSSSGWSARGGQVKNPYALDRSPCGSSSGSAVAVAANLVTAALGTETDGSILCPSASNCIVGIKPTLGLVSRAGVIPIAHSQDVVGPMARSVTDASILLGALTGFDPHDPITKGDGSYFSDYTQFLDADGLKGARIGIPREVYFDYSPKANAIADAAIAKMKDLGAEIIDPANVPTAARMQDSDAEMTVLLHEFKADLNRYLADLVSSPIRTLEELIQFNQVHNEVELKYFGQDIFVKAQETSGLADPKYIRALEENRRLSREEGIDAIMNEKDLDALAFPTGPPPWVTDLVDGDRGIGNSTQVSALSGYPAISVPAGFVFDLPVGITFLGRSYSEPKLIKLAYAFEQATRVRTPPRYLPTIA